MAADNTVENAAATETANENSAETYIASFRGQLGRRETAPISRDLFERVKASGDGLGDILDIEESYEVNLGNYIEFERGVTAQIASDLVHPAFSMEAMDHARRTIGRLLDNLLSTSFSFQEQTRRRLKRLGGRSMLQRFEAELVDLRARLPALVVVHEIRRYAQHEGSSVSGISIGGRRLEEGDAIVIERTLVATFKRALIKVDRVTPGADRERLDALLAEVVDPRGRVDLVPLIRHYMTALSEILVFTRLMLDDLHADWADANRQALACLENPEGKVFPIMWFT